MENLYLVVGLGNPGREYAGTRHNAGFLLVEQLAARWRARWEVERKFSARMAKAEQGERRVLLCEPQTFMNASGETVGAMARFYRLPPQRVLVVVDDADLPFGHLRLRGQGSSGGHHGLESIEQHLMTREFPRLRIGIGRKAGEGRQITNYVLGQFAAAERELLEAILVRASEQVETWLSAGLLEAMNRFNGAVNAPSSKGKTE